MSAKKIAIIGAGNSGISAFNACREQGLSATVFEKTDQICGQWLYREEVLENCTSIYKSLTCNSSKEMTAFSNFPPPKDSPNYMPHSQMAQYIELFANKIGFKENVKLRHEIINCEQNYDYEESGKWMLTVKDSDNNQFTEVFDGVMVCTGQAQSMEIPEFEGMDLFKGSVIHSHEYKDTKGYENKRVVVVGCGISGSDIASELAEISSQVFMSVRSGAWISSRLGLGGCPYDYMSIRRAIFNLIPHSILNYLAELLANSRINHNFYGLKPRHKYFDQLVFFAETLPMRIIFGQIIIKGSIQRFTENGVIFNGEEKETPCDMVILATGYRRSFPFLEESILKPNNLNIRCEHLNIYRNQFLPHLKHPNTLCFIGLALVQGSILPIAELQSRWFALLITDKVKGLPNQKQMWKEINKKKKWVEKNFPEWRTKYLDCHWIPTMDNLAKKIGAKPNLIKYFFTDPKLWKSLYFGPCLPYQYRLEGPNKWPEARNAILTVKDRLRAPMGRPNKKSN